MLETRDLLAAVTGGDAALSDVMAALIAASRAVYRHVKDDDGLTKVDTRNRSGEIQIGLDVLADGIFRDALSPLDAVAHIVSEEQPGLTGRGGAGYGVALDPLDGSKSARVGIPCGSIFAIYAQVSTAADFVGRNIVASGFFVYGIRHELFVACAGRVFRFREEDEAGLWKDGALGRTLPHADMLAINASNVAHWPEWLRAYYSSRFAPPGPDRRPWNMRWYASLVSEVKRLLVEGGLFGYPADDRPGYAQGHLRLVYEALPMAYLVCAMGGAASDGERSILSLDAQELHRKTPLFLGERQAVERLVAFRRRAVASRPSSI